MKDALRKGEITAGHARALLAHPTPEAALRDVINRQLSVRQTEALAARAPLPNARWPMICSAARARTPLHWSAISASSSV